MVRPITPQELIDLGILVPPVVESPVIANDRGQPQAINQAQNLPAIYANAVRYALSQGRHKVILFGSGAGSMSPTRVAEDTCQELRRYGIPAENINHHLASAERRRITDGFEAMPTAVRIALKPGSVPRRNNASSGCTRPKLCRTTPA